MSSKRKTGRRPGRPSKYPPEFRRDAVAMVLDEGRPIAEVARALGVNSGTLGNWVGRERVELGERGGVTRDDRAELADLRAENAKLRMEREILSKAAVFFAKESDGR